MKEPILFKKVAIFLCAFIFLLNFKAYSQCENPVPTGTSSQSFCDIDENTIADLDINETTITWYDAPSGGNILNSSTNLQNTATYYADNTKDGGCSPTRLAIVVKISGFPPKTDILIGKCANNKETIADLNPKIEGIVWYNQYSGGAPLDPTHILEDGITYWAEQNIDGCTSTRSSTTVSLIAPPPPTIAEFQYFCATPPPTVFDLVALDVGETDNIEWYDSKESLTPLSSSTTLIHGKTYWGTATNPSGCESEDRTPTTVTSNISTNAGSNGVYTDCVISPTVNLYDVLGLNSENIPAEKTGIWTGPSPLDGGYLGVFTFGSSIEGTYTYTVMDPLGLCSDTSSTVKIETVKLPTAPENQFFCAIDNPTVNDLEANGDLLKWYIDENSSSTPLNTTTPLIEADYWVTQTDEKGCESSPRVKVSVTVNTPLAPTTTEPAPYYCFSDNKTVNDLNITGTNIKWYLTETTTTPVDINYILTTGSYWASQTDEDDCESPRTEIVATIISTIPPTTTEPTQNFCISDKPTIADLNVDGDNIQWYQTEISTTPLVSSELLEEGSYWASQTENINNCESERIEITVILDSAPPPTTDNITPLFCKTDNPTIADITLNEDAVLWYDSELDTKVLDPTELLEHEKSYWASNIDLITGCESEERLEIKIFLFAPLPPTIDEFQTFCSNPPPTVSNLVALDIDDGNILNWYDTMDSTTPLSSATILIHNKTYWGTATDPSGCESDRIPTTVSINLSTNAGSNGVYADCLVSTTVNLYDILGNNDENLPAEKSGTWTGPSPLDGGYLGTFTFNSSIEGTYTYTVKDPLGLCPDEFSTVEIETVKIPTANENQTFCAIDNPTVNDLEANGTLLKWYADENSSSTPLKTTDLLIETDYWVTQTDEKGCESSPRVKVSVTINTPLAPTTTEPTPSFCLTDYKTVNDLNITGTNVKWYLTETTTTPLEINYIVTTGSYWASQTDEDNCESPRTEIVVTIITTPLPTTLDDIQEFCAFDKPTISDLEVIGANIKWYLTETSTTPLVSSDLLKEGSYWASQTENINNCESERIEITVILNSALPPTTDNTTPIFCKTDNPTIADITLNEDALLWYDSELDSLVIDPTEPLEDGKSYWASNIDTITGCESEERLKITVSLFTPPNATTDNTTPTFCSADNPTTSSIEVEGDLILWFETETSTTPLNENTILENEKEYWALNTDAATGCESAIRLKITPTLLTPPPPVIEETEQSFCSSDSPTVADLESDGNVKWFATATETVPLDPSQFLTDDTEYWAANLDDSTNCISTTRVVIKAYLTNPETPELIANGNEFCIIDKPVIEDLSNNVTIDEGSTINWYTSYPDGPALDSSTELIDGELYFGINTNDYGCANLTPLEVTVDLNFCDEYDIEFYDGFSPNGDGINDTYPIKNLRTLYPDFSVEFFNRWGNLVYKTDASKPDWDGRLQGDQEFVPSGVYFFIVHFNKDGKKPVQNKLYLSR